CSRFAQDHVELRDEPRDVSLRIRRLRPFFMRKLFSKDAIGESDRHREHRAKLFGYLVLATMRMEEQSLDPRVEELDLRQRGSSSLRLERVQLVVHPQRQLGAGGLGELLPPLLQRVEALKQPFPAPQIVRIIRSALLHASAIVRQMPALGG